MNFSLQLSSDRSVTSVCVLQLSSTGEVDVTVNMEKVLSKHDGPKDLNSLVGMYLYVAVLLQEDTGTHTTTTHPQPDVYIAKTCSHAQVCSPLLSQVVSPRRRSLLL